ncbi:MAG: phenylacetate-CoA oxygenase subunit PaaJ [Bacteroidetes bacterium 24-39-8]|jgi:ring-1,2-phenylacetyl-CoA epoxidase subunit PaaD|nr:MAG: phenylacetate-CoA oxygenase subunit PaaJ [Sphingobacteriia bacterium 35-40-8]OYZ52966.1 MAG: phenylacetate-CoA oxygenase subunit PaaJ [Bacteroidetes bacterium 24-39-8]OZA65822.1 MAG: phenylacetate-CoA oxygenase subunit PaaJ [Sphingobacteriia bacterium 39-39-8]HQR92249.1 phenylacetate-CoA oxygenase subunit PaaJ [Sediminibacterium sp.]HQS54275.1 phenylacetate-CoA oxygenase subunit PaaJ [Sediminibacterium sp.]
MESSLDIDKEKRVWDILETVSDPEIPVLSIVDLGIVRGIELMDEPTSLTISITPTYTGCPAMDMMAAHIRIALADAGFLKVQINQTLSPAWTTDWMSEAGKIKLKAYGIAAPVAKAFNKEYLEDLQMECPNCGSTQTKLISEFSSTACKALFQCKDCLEPFDYFKCH